MSQHLYEISKEFSELQEMAKNAEDVDESMMLALRDTLESVQISFEEKAQNIVNVMRNVTSTASAIDEEIKRLKAKKASVVNKEKWFRRYLSENMQQTGISKIECEFFTITLSSPPAAVEITNELELPEDLIDVETKIKPKLSEIKKRLQANEEVPGAELTDGTRRLTIR